MARYFTSAGESDDRKPLVQERFSSTFLAVNHGEHTGHDSASRLYRCAGLQCRRSGCNDIFDDRNPVAGGKRPLDELTRSVGFRFLANGECSNHRRLLNTGVRDRVRHRIGPESETSDGTDVPTALSERVEP